MPLKLRPTGLGAGIDKDRPDYTVYCGEWALAASLVPTAFGRCSEQHCDTQSAANLLAQSWNIIVRGMCREQTP